MKRALLIAAGVVAYVVGVAIATAALSRTDCSEGSAVLAGLALIVAGLATVGWTALHMDPGRLRLSIGVLVLLFALTTVSIGVLFYGLCGMD